jgi:hypothetical protein
MIPMTNAYTRASLSDKSFLCALFGTILILALDYRVRHPKGLLNFLGGEPLNLVLEQEFHEK